MCTSSILHLCTISLERFIGIRYPLWVKNKSKRIVLLKIVFVWTIALAITSPITVLGVVEEKNILDSGTCVLNNKHFRIYGSIFAFFIPLAIMILMYALTVRMLSKQAKMCRNRRGGGDDREGEPMIRRSTCRRNGPRQRNFYAGATYMNQSLMEGSDRSSSPTPSMFIPRYRALSSRHNTISLPLYNHMGRRLMSMSSGNCGVNNEMNKGSDGLQRDMKGSSVSTPGLTMSGVDSGNSCGRTGDNSTKSAGNAGVLNRKNKSFHGRISSKSKTLPSNNKPNRSHDKVLRTYTPPSMRHNYNTTFSSTSGRRAHSGGLSSNKNGGVLFNFGTSSCTSLNGNGNGNVGGKGGSVVGGMARHCDLSQNAGTGGLHFCNGHAEELSCTSDDHHHHHHQHHLHHPPHHQHHFKNGNNSSSSSSSSPTSSTKAKGDVPKRLRDLVKKHHVAVKAATILLMKREGGQQSGQGHGQSQGQGQGQGQGQNHTHFMLPQAAASSFTTTTTTPPLSATTSIRRDNSVRTEQKASKVLGVVFLIFVVCWAPFFSVNILSVLCQSCQLQPTLITAFVWLGFASSTLNPIIYTIFNNIFRNTFIKLLCCRYRLLHRARRNSNLNALQNGLVTVNSFHPIHNTSYNNTSNSMEESHC